LKGASVGRENVKAALRNHPKVFFHGRNAWPPPPPGSALDRRGQARLPVDLSAGILRGATIFRTRGYAGLPDHLKLQIEHERRTQVTDLWVDDDTVLEHLRDFLNQHKGLSLDQLGKLDIDL
jgi:hypothetical protein